MLAVQECPIGMTAWLEEAGKHNGQSAVALRVAVLPKQSETASPWQATIENLAAFEDLVDNWDGLGAVAPTNDLLMSAVGLACVWDEKGVEPPQRVVPGIEGTVIFEWQFADGSYGEVEVVRPFFAEVMLIEPGKTARHWTLPID